MFIPVFEGTVKGGKLYFDNRDSFDKYVAGLNGRVEVTVRKWRKQRSLPQLRYYWGVIIKMLSEELGYDPQETHEAMKFLFLRVEHEGKPTTVRSTRDLTTVEFMEYFEKIQIWAATELNLVIPDPNQTEFL